MARLQGTSVTLFQEVKVGTDPFGAPIYEENPVEVENVLIGEPSTEDIINELNISGKRLAYTLAIPKGDTHEWKDRTVEFWGEKFRTIGFPETGIQENIPLRWGQNVKVERYG